MIARILSGTVIGLDGILIEVEVDVAKKGFPGFTIVGLPDKAVGEAKERVRTAINNISFQIPDTRITVNLAPADIPKAGSAFDLPIAVGILAASGMVKKDVLQESLFIGELSLKGDVRRVSGAISIALLAKSKKLKKIFVPRENITEVVLVDGIDVYPIDSLVDLTLHLNEVKLIPPFPHEDFISIIREEKYDNLFEDIKGQETAKRALEVAAAGFHNVILKGPPGTGKTLISRAFPSILPPMEKEEILEVTKIYSVAGLLYNKNFIASRPFRCPHHTTSRIGLVGGGSNPSPGEISLAHRGVLFLDEIPEFPRTTLESLRQPLEDGFITISRASGTLIFPSRFLLLAASNPCPCGYLGHEKRPCRCLPGAILKYSKRLSGPLLDRIDLHIDVPSVSEEKLTSNILSESSLEVRKRVVKARVIQKKRFENLKIFSNGEMSSAQIKKFCHLSPEAIELKQAISKLSLSARSYFKTIKIGQTIADLNEKEIIESSYITEALQFRSYDE
jgi:magnesium chelatase family protein